VVHCTVRPRADTYFPVLPSRGDKKVMFNGHEVLTGVWTSVEMQLALSRGYEVLEVFEMHVFPSSTNQLFADYNKVMFKIKDQAKRENNPGKKLVAKVSLNAPFGKWGQNVARFAKTEVVTNPEDLHRKLFGPYDNVDVDFLNDHNALVHTKKEQQMTFHDASNVYIAAFITAYARRQLFLEALEPIGVNVLYHDTDSVIFVSEKGENPIPSHLLGLELGQWENELGEVTLDNGEKIQDYFTEYVSTAPKTYALKSFSGKNDVVKCKGFGLHWKNAQIMHFDSLKEQAEAMAMEVDVEDTETLCLHKGEKKMVRNLFNINMKEDKGKVLNRGYDKRQIRIPVYDQQDRLKMIDTEPFGYEGATKVCEGCDHIFQL
jgi:hypothetical protein